MRRGEGIANGHVAATARICTNRRVKSTAPHSGVVIDDGALWRSIQTLAQIGAYDAPGGLRGVNRLALTDADTAARRQVMSWMEECGLTVRIDRIGNVFGRRAGRDDTLAPVMSGSHIDSVTTGGAFDGSLGVLSALEAVRALNRAEVTTLRPIEVAFFTNEEGARFPTDMLGSAVACGRIPLETAWAVRDRDGVTVKEELERTGFLGEHDPLRAPPHAFVEVHIEQGPVLAAASMQLGIVTGVQAISWQRLTIRGRTAHAGTTPMSLRRDAGVAAAMINVKMYEMATSGRFGKHMRATMGRIAMRPNRVNVVPREVVCTVDLRNPDDDNMGAAEAELRRYLEEVAERSGVTIAVERTAQTGRVVFAEEILRVMEDKAGSRGLTHQRLLSGAGHDAQEFAAVCPAGMIFVPGLYDGISHNPRELSTLEACAQGAQVLLDAVVELASR